MVLSSISAPERLVSDEKRGVVGTTRECRSRRSSWWCRGHDCGLAVDPVDDSRGHVVFAAVVDGRGTARQDGGGEWGHIDWMLRQTGRSSAVLGFRLANLDDYVGGLRGRQVAGVAMCAMPQAHIATRTVKE